MQAQSPVISSPLSATGTLGQPFSYQISASGDPTGFDAAALPDGLTVNTTTGLISGTPTTAGNFNVNISATNADGTANATLVLLVSDLYADDGIDDAWQVQYFGHNNPNAQPGVDPDADGDDNSFEFTAGLDPTDSTSRFVVRMEDEVVVALGTRKITFGPLVSGRSYSVEFKSDLTTGEWAALPDFTQSDTGATRTVTDLDAAGPRKFYHVRITKE